MRKVLMAVLTASLILSVPAASANEASAVNPRTIEASGTFTFTTSAGILPTWTSAGIALVGISPGSVITTSASLNARISLPVVAKTRTANATAGGFRFLNSETGESVRCQVPTIDTRARLVGCVLSDGTSSNLFVITEIADRFKVRDDGNITTYFRGIDLSFVDSATAARMNTELGTNVFSASVTVARGALEVSRELSTSP
jgi:hypothetical protein